MSDQMDRVMRRLGAAILGLVALGVVVVGASFAQMPNSSHAPMMPVAPDDRQPVVVTDATRTLVLAEMRDMLAAAQGVAEAIGKRDWPAAASAAEKSGLKAFQGMPKQVMMELPEDFRALGMQSHMAFDAVADAVTSTSDPAIVAGKLGEAMQLCVACHKLFRFAAKP